MPMPMSRDELEMVLAQLRRARSVEWPRLDRIRRYMHNEAVDLHIPDEATDEYRELVDQSRFNILPLVVRTLAQNLFVDGYRPTTVDTDRELTEAGNLPIWDAWQANRMDSRQKGIYSSAITYGYSFATVLPGRPWPKITPWSPLRCTTLWEDEINDEWPVYAMTLSQSSMLSGVEGVPLGSRIDLYTSSRFGPLKVRVYDANYVYTIDYESSGTRAPGDPKIEEHGLGVCPVVRFLDTFDLDGCSWGKVEPLLPLQRQINQTTFSLLMAQHYSAFRQRWATGMLIERDENGNPVAPWTAGMDKVWQNESVDGRFGDFEETDLSGFLDSRREALLFAGSTSQTPPHNLVVGANISNIAAEALAALESAHGHDTQDHQDGFGEDIEQLLRLTGKAGDDMATWEDISAEVSWADRTPRSLGQTIDALGKMAAQLDIPVQALWERVPGSTYQERANWLRLKEQKGLMDELERLVNGDGEEPPPTPDRDPEAEPVQEEPVAVGANGSAPA